MLQVASVPLPDGEVLLTYLDVSDTARVERALRERNEALETAGRLKTEFVANVSHELRTPLNSVIGFAEILHNEYFGALNSSQHEYSRGILDSAHQLMALINDMIDLATIEAGYLELEPGRVDIPEMLQGVMNLTRERARGRGLDIDLRCPASIGAIEGDERRLKQALFNLVSNAIKFTPPGGAIRIEAERCRDEVLLSVADTGGRHRGSGSCRQIPSNLSAAEVKPVPGSGCRWSGAWSSCTAALSRSNRRRAAKTASPAGCPSARSTPGAARPRPLPRGSKSRPIRLARSQPRRLRLRSLPPAGLGCGRFCRVKAREKRKLRVIAAAIYNA